MKLKLLFGLIFASTFLLLGTSKVAAATRTWSGSVNGNWSVTGNWLENSAPVAGDDLVFGTTGNNRTNTNDLSAGTSFNSITFSGINYILNGNSINLTNGITVGAIAGGQLNLPVVISASQSISVNALGGLTFASNLTLSNNLTIISNGSTYITGNVTGPESLLKEGTGMLYLNNSTANTYSGSTYINAGAATIYNANALGSALSPTVIAAGAALNIETPAGISLAEPFVLQGGSGDVGGGALRNYQGNNTITGAITLSAETSSTIGVDEDTTLTISGLISGGGALELGNGGTLILTNDNTHLGDTAVQGGHLIVNGDQPSSGFTQTGITAVMGGNGSVGPLTFLGSGNPQLDPGNASAPGILFTGNVTLASGGVFHVDLNGTTPGTGHDQLNVSGTVILANSTLEVNLNTSLTSGEAFTIINNDGSDGITNTFAGLAEGATFTSAGKLFQITYVGGTGNDVVITHLGATPLYRFWSEAYKGHFYTSSETEKNNLIANNPNWTFEGTAYRVYSASNCTGKAAVYRFWSNNYKHHFYTRSETEKNNLIANNTNWSYEGVAFCSDSTQVVGTNPVHRFWSNNYKGHFYTISEAEKNNLIASNPNWSYEGTSYYGFP